MAEPICQSAHLCQYHQDVFKSQIETATKIDRLSEDVHAMKDLSEKLVTMVERVNVLLERVGSATEAIEHLTSRVGVLEVELAIWKRTTEKRMFFLGLVIALVAAVIQIAPSLLKLS